MIKNIIRYFKLKRKVKEKNKKNYSYDKGPIRPGTEEKGGVNTNPIGKRPDIKPVGHSGNQYQILKMYKLYKKLNKERIEKEL